MKQRLKNETRRTFLKKTALAATTISIPAFFHSLVRGQTAASNRITIGCIGVGRMGLLDLQDIIRHDDVQVVAVCDVDSNRALYARDYVDNYYRKQTKDLIYSDCRAYRDSRELLERRDIDAVLICTPDHWHALPAIEAAKAGKDIFLQKPLTYSLQEGRLLSNTVRQYGNVFQVGSQQRSDQVFRQASELVRNGRIGRLHTIKIGMGIDTATSTEPLMPVPANLDYETWLGPAPWSPYTEKRVHPQSGYDRPGWLRISDYCLGMITGWGAHHIDIAHWAMDTDYSGPIQIKGKGIFPKDGLWDVHGSYDIEYQYANGVTMEVADNTVNPQGIRFIGDEGWIHVQRYAIHAYPESLLKSPIRPEQTHLYFSNNHKRNFIDCIKTRKTTIAPVEVGHRSCSACILGYIAMQTGQILHWDPQKEVFLNSDTGNRMLYRPERQFV